MPDADHGSRDDRPKAPDLVDLLMKEIAARGGEGREAPWLEENVMGADGKPLMNRQSAWAFLSRTRLRWLNAEDMHCLAVAFGWSDATVYIGNAILLGLEPPREGAFAQMLPAWVDELPLKELMTSRDVILRFGEAHGLTD